MIGSVGGVGLALVVGGLQACAAGGSDDSFWAPGGTPPQGGVGGASSATSGSTSSTGGQASSTTGASTTATTGQTSSTSGQTSSTSGQTSSTSTVAAASSSTSGGGVSWANDIFDPIFGPSGTSPCSINGTCHTNNQSSFKCGTTATSCYTGFVNAQWISPGSGASSSSLVNAATSPLCGSLGGNMPRTYGTCITQAQLQTIQTWLAAGAPDN